MQRNQKYRKQFFTILALCVCTIGVFARRAEACVDGTTDSDQALWTQVRCRREFIDWQFNTYDMRGWDDWGLEDVCNLNLPYAKTLNAAFLIAYGLPKSEHREDSLMFHGGIDYQVLVSANGGDFHDRIYYGKADASDDTLASFNVPWFGRNYVELHCPLFDQRRPDANNPIIRASAFVHENWHAWQKRYNIGERDYHGHIEGPLEECTIKSCDRWYSHEISDYDFGTMHEHDEGTRPIPKVHSPMQAEVEFLCDMSTFGSPWVTNGQVGFARSWAARRISGNFTKPPPFSCGHPKMLFPVPAVIEGTISFPNPKSEGQPIVRNGEDVCNRITVSIQETEPALRKCGKIGDFTGCWGDYDGEVHSIPATGAYRGPDDKCYYHLNVTSPIVIVNAEYQLIESDSDPLRATWTPEVPMPSADRRRIKIRSGLFQHNVRPGTILQQDLQLYTVHPSIIQ